MSRKTKTVAVGVSLMAMLFAVIGPAAAQDAVVSPDKKAVEAIGNVDIGGRIPVRGECTTDADCPAKECSTVKCLGLKGIVGADGTVIGGGMKCVYTPIDNCLPPPAINECALKYKGSDEAIKCCEMGFDTDPAKEKCCVQHLTHHEDPGTPDKPATCGRPETCPTCPDCKPPVIDCNDPHIVINPAFKSCCESHGGNLWFMMAPNNCVHSSDDCNIIVNVGGDVNGQMNICCNVINNTGTITDTTITQACNNVTGGGTSGGTTGAGTGTPTAPASLGTCEVKCKEADCSIAVNTGGQGVAWTVTYSPPPDAGAVASAVLRQTSGDVPLTPEEPAPGGSGALSIKTISDPSSLPPFTVFTQKPSSLQGDYLPKFTVEVQLNDLSDHPLATLTCGNETALEAKGGGSGCGCFLGASAGDFGANAIFLIGLFGGVPWLFRRKKSDSSES